MVNWYSVLIQPLKSKGQNAVFCLLSRYWKLKQLWLLVAWEKIFQLHFYYLQQLPMAILYLNVFKITVALLSAVVRKQNIYHPM